MPTRIPTDSEPGFALPRRLLAPRDAFTAVGRNLLRSSSKSSKNSSSTSRRHRPDRGLLIEIALPYHETLLRQPEVLDFLSHTAICRVKFFLLRLRACAAFPFFALILVAIHASLIFASCLLFVYENCSNLDGTFLYLRLDTRTLLLVMIQAVL